MNLLASLSSGEVDRSWISKLLRVLLPGGESGHGKRLSLEGPVSVCWWGLELLLTPAGRKHQPSPQTGWKKPSEDCRAEGVGMLPANTGGNWSEVRTAVTLPRQVWSWVLTGCRTPRSSGLCWRGWRCRRGRRRFGPAAGAVRSLRAPAPRAALPRGRWRGVFHRQRRGDGVGTLLLPPAPGSCWQRGARITCHYRRVLLVNALCCMLGIRRDNFPFCLLGQHAAGCLVVCLLLLHMSCACSSAFCPKELWKLKRLRGAIPAATFLVPIFFLFPSILMWLVWGEGESI